MDDHHDLFGQAGALRKTSDRNYALWAFTLPRSLRFLPHQSLLPNLASLSMSAKIKVKLRERAGSISCITWKTYTGNTNLRRKEDPNLRHDLGGR